MSLLSAYLLRGKLKTERPSEWDMILPRPPRWGQAEQRCGEIPGQAQKNDIRRKRQRESRVHGDSEHRIVTPQSGSAALRRADLSGRAALKPC